MKRRSQQVSSSTNLERDKKGCFKRICGSSIHEHESNSKVGTESGKLVNLKSGKKLRKAVYSTLLENGIINESTKFVCESCVGAESCNVNPPLTQLRNKELSSGSDEEEFDDTDENTLCYKS